MTRYIKWLGILSALLLTYACFIPWVDIVSKGIVVTGVDSTGTNFGKPGYFHLIMIIFFLVFALVQRVWAKRFNLLVTALNLGWGIRNFLIIGLCEGGECPVKKTGLYLVLTCSVLMLIASLFPDTKVGATEKSNLAAD